MDDTFMDTESPQSTVTGVSEWGVDRGPRATYFLLLTTLFWSLSFPWMKNWQVAAGSCPGGPLLATFTVIALRMALAVLLLAAWQPRLFTMPAAREHGLGLLLGSVFFVGFSLQAWGLTWTTPALSAFFTCLCSAWVPLLGWACLSLPVTGLTLLGLAVALTGTAVLVEGGWKMGTGEQLTFVAAILFAVQMLILDRCGRRIRSAHLTASFLSVTGLLGGLCGLVLAISGPGVTAWWLWLTDMLRNPYVLVNLFFLAFLPTVLSFHWMNVYQPQVTANRAALIYLLEPVFTAIISVAWHYEPLSPHLLLGGALIVAGNLLVELPGWMRMAGQGILEE
jgi:drug/metabolite transporter (DMT)-like permease